MGCGAEIWEGGEIQRAFCRKGETGSCPPSESIMRLWTASVEGGYAVGPVEVAVEVDRDRLSYVNELLSMLHTES